MIGHEERLAAENMTKLVFKMALPAVAAQLINLLYSIVDRIYIGHISGVGADALAGIGVTGSVIILITAFAMITSMGAAPIASIALGGGDRERATHILSNSFTLLVVFNVLCMAVVYIFMEPILVVTGASEVTLPYAEGYLSVYMLGTFFVLVTNGLNTFINAQGRPSVAMWAVIAGAVANIILDPLFIFTFDMGIEGAAWASVISQGISAIWILKFLVSSEATLKIEKQFLRLSKPIVISILVLGVSPFIMASTEAVVCFVLNGTLKAYGDIHISSMAIIQSALLIVSVPLNGFSQGFMPIVSYNYGQGNKKRVKECLKIVVIVMTLFNFVLTMFFVLFPELVALIFTTDGELISTIERVMPAFFIGMTLFGLQRTFQNMFIALEQARISIFIAILRKIILLIPLIMILPKWMDEMGVYWAETISDAIAATVCTIIFCIVFPKIMATPIKK